MNNVNLTINGFKVSAPENCTVLEAARLAGIEIPSLCWFKGLNSVGSCRVCVVEIEGARGLVASCVYPVSEGMAVNTNTERVHEARKTTLELILSNHRTECLTCYRNPICELQKLAKYFGIDESRFKSSASELQPQIENSALHLVRDNSKCILCRRCVAACEKNQAVAVIGVNDRGFDTHISCAFDRDLAEVACVSCGQCITVCPTGALAEKDDTEQVWAALADPSKHVVVGTAPSIRVTLGECFSLPVGTNVEGKMVSALRRLGFDGVFDMDVAADLTIMEEGTEFIERLKKGGKLPLITSCSPGWVRFCEHYYPEFIPNLSTCKSPQQMFGAMMKSYYAKEKGIDPKDIFVVSVIPCTAKKFEISREDQGSDGLRDVDAAITTRELSRMVLRAGILFNDLKDEAFDPAFGISSGAGVIFGASGGVMEAALRTVYEIMTGRKPPSIEFSDVRGMEGVKTAEYMISGTNVRVAACSSLTNAKKVLESVKSGEAEYDFIEIMCCPGGCINGGGQPIQSAGIRNFTDLRSKRAEALYAQDSDMPLRKSHENPLVIKLYDDFLGNPGGRLSHKLLHTSYKKGKK